LYDGAGNRTGMTVTGETTPYAWDAEGELSGTDGSSFVYDADGSRLVRTTTQGTTVYLPGQEVTVDADGNVTAARYYSFGGKAVAVRTARGLGGVTLVVTDHQGTPIASFAATGNPKTTRSAGSTPIPSARCVATKPSRETTGSWTRRVTRRG
jgi:hypothetical protein